MRKTAFGYYKTFGAQFQIYIKDRLFGGVNCKKIKKGKMGEHPSDTQIRSYLAGPASTDFQI